MTVVLDVAMLLQIPPGWMTQPGFLLALALLLTAAATVILWDEFQGPARTNSDVASGHTNARGRSSEDES